MVKVEVVRNETGEIIGLKIRSWGFSDIELENLPDTLEWVEVHTPFGTTMLSNHDFNKDEVEDENNRDSEKE